MNFSSFYKEYHSALLQTAYRYLNKEDAEDIVQDVMSMMWEKRNAFAFVGNVRAYAFAAVRNRCIDSVKHRVYCREYYRKTLAAQRLDMAEMLVSGSSVVTAEYEAKELRSRVARAVDRLPRRCRQIFNMSRVDGMRYAEISAALGISVNTVDCQITLALKRLRRYLRVS